MSRPELGERVRYFIDEANSVLAEVVDVTYWDLIDVRLPDGTILRGVRRVVSLVNADTDKLFTIPPVAGRFVRVDDGY